MWNSIDNKLAKISEVVAPIVELTDNQLNTRNLTFEGVYFSCRTLCKMCVLYYCTEVILINSILIQIQSLAIETRPV